MSWDRIGEQLYLGSEPPPGLTLREAGFDSLLLCAQEIQPSGALFPGVRVFHFPFDDKRDFDADVQVAQQAAKQVLYELKKGRRVLVTCRSGENRSGLVTALALVFATGMSGAEALALVQSRRPSALRKKTARQYLLKIPRT